MRSTKGSFAFRLVRQKFRFWTTGVRLHRVQLPPDNSNLNPRLLESRANSNQNRFPLDFRHTLTVILPSVSQTLDNSNLPLTRSSFCFPLRSFLYIFTLDNSNHVLTPSEVEKTNSLLATETLNFEFPIVVFVTIFSDL